MKPIITIKEARKILGSEYAQMTDEEIERIIDDLHMIAKLTIKDFLEKKAKSSTH